MNIKKVIIGISFVVLTILFLWMFAFSEASSQLTTLDIRTELAATSEERIQGLMNRQELCDQCGMIFDFGGSEQVSFWMKDTIIPLDIIMIEQNGVIDSIHKNTTPLNTEKRYRSEGEVRYVLEINAGKSDKFNLEAGDRLDIKDLLEQSLPYGEL